jgi:hypothetical protein
MALGSAICGKVAGVPPMRNGVAYTQAQFVDQNAEGMDGLALRSPLGLGFTQRTRGGSALATGSIRMGGWESINSSSAQASRRCHST